MIFLSAIPILFHLNDEDMQTLQSTKGLQSYFAHGERLTNRFDQIINMIKASRLSVRHTLLSFQKRRLLTCEVHRLEQMAKDTRKMIKESERIIKSTEAFFTKISRQCKETKV